MSLKQHALSALFPALPASELASLAADIKARGLRQPIVVFEGKVLDGWHRYQACKMADVELRTVDYKGSDPVALVKGYNWLRRHLTESQRAATEVAMSGWLPNGATSAPGAEVKSAAEMASEAHVSTRTIEQAKVVHANGSKELKTAVKEGAISVKKAEKIARLPKKKQAAAIRAPTEPKPDPRDAEIDRLKARLEEFQMMMPELTNMAASTESFKSDKSFKDMIALRAELDATRRRRDELMTENTELKKAVAHWKRKAEKK